MKFENFELGVNTLKSIERKGFEEPTKIQRKAMPKILEGRDVVAGSATGSGKTLAFGVGMIENYKKDVKGIQGLVLTPTRELAKQVSKQVESYSKDHKHFVVSIYGGVSIKPQFRQLKKADFVVATPGRLLDHIRRGSIDLSKVNTLVLDEADRMLDMGFIDDVEKIMKRTPKKKQTILTSATIRSEVLRLANRYMNNPVKIFGKKKVDPKNLKQVYYDVKRHTKFPVLLKLLKKEDSELVMVFCNTRRTVDYLERKMKKKGVNAHAIHGGFSQKQRDSAMRKFKHENVEVLVCTDVAARGLDINNITHIYNYDIPRESKQYMHRIGRTARAGEKGKAINLLAPEEHGSFRKILRKEDVDIEKRKLQE